MKSVFKEPVLECFLDSDAKVLFHVWMSKPTNEQFKQGLTKVFDQYQIYKKEVLPMSGNGLPNHCGMNFLHKWIRCKCLTQMPADSGACSPRVIHRLIAKIV